MTNKTQTTEYQRPGTVLCDDAAPISQEAWDGLKIGTKLVDPKENFFSSVHRFLEKVQDGQIFNAFFNGGSNEKQGHERNRQGSSKGLS